MRSHFLLPNDFWGQVSVLLKSLLWFYVPWSMTCDVLHDLTLPTTVWFSSCDLPWYLSSSRLVAKSCPALETPSSSVMGFSRQEDWSGLPFPSPGDLPDPGIKPGSSALKVDSLPPELWGKPVVPEGAPGLEPGIRNRFGWDFSNKKFSFSLFLYPSIHPSHMLSELSHLQNKLELTYLLTLLVTQWDQLFWLYRTR